MSENNYYCPGCDESGMSWEELKAHGKYFPEHFPKATGKTPDYDALDRAIAKKKAESGSEVDNFYKDLFKKLGAERSVIDEPIDLPVGPENPNYDTDKLPKSPEDNVYVPDDIDEDDQYITNINKYRFNTNDTLEPVNPSGAVKKNSEEAYNSQVVREIFDFIGPEENSVSYEDLTNRFGKQVTDTFLSIYLGSYVRFVQGDRIAKSLGGTLHDPHAVEANDHMNEDKHDLTMPDDSTNLYMNGSSYYEPSTKSTMDTDTAPLSEEAQESKYTCSCGQEFDTEDQLDNHYEHDHKRMKPDNSGDANIGYEANDPDMSTGLFSDTDKDDNTNNFGELNANTNEEDTDVVSDTPLGEEGFVDKGTHYESSHSTPEEYYNGLGDDKHAVLRSHGITGQQREDLAQKDYKDLPEHVKDSIHNNYTPSTTYYDKQGNRIDSPPSTESKKKDHLLASSTEVKIGAKFTNSEDGVLGLPKGEYEVIDYQYDDKHSGIWGTFSDIQVRNLSSGQTYWLPTGNAQMMFGIEANEMNCPVCGGTGKQRRNVSDDNFPGEDNCRNCGGSGKQTIGEADQSIGTDNPQDLMDNDKSVGYDFDKKEGDEYDKNQDTNYECTDCDQEFGDDFEAYNEHMTNAHDKPANEAGVDDEGYYKPDQDENFTCLQCKKDFGNNFKAFFQHSRTAHVNGEAHSTEVSIDDFRRIVNNFQAEDLQFQDGKDTVDVQTANAVVTVYDKLSPQNQQKANSVIQTTGGVIKMASIAFGESYIGETFAGELDRTPFNQKYEDDIYKGMDWITRSQKQFEDEDHKGLYAAFNQPEQSHLSHYGSGSKGPIDRHLCPKCNGTGWDSGAGMDGWTCDRCNGTGHIGESYSSETLRVGSRVHLTDDAANNYGVSPSKTFRIQKISRSTDDHPGYDEGVGGNLYDLEGFNNSVYDYELVEGNEAMAMTGGKYPSDEDDKTHDMTSLDDDAGNVGAVDERISKELTTWGNDTIEQHTDKATPLDGPKTEDYQDAVKDIDAEPNKPMGESYAKEGDEGFVCHNCGTYFSSPESADKHEDMTGHKVGFGTYTKASKEPEYYKYYTGENILESLSSDCGCDKGKEAFYRPLFEKLGMEYDTPADKGEKAARDDFKKSELERLQKIKDERTPAEKAEYSEEAVAGVSGDYGNTKPYWCLTCGEGYDEIDDVDKHMEATGHKGRKFGEAIDDDKNISDWWDKNKDQLPLFGASHQPYWDELGDTEEKDMVRDHYKKYIKSHEAKDTIIDFPPANRYYECGTCGDSFDTREEYNEHKDKYPGKHESPNTASVKSKQTEESFGAEWDGMTPIQRYEWLVGKVGAFEVLDNYLGVSSRKWGQMDLTMKEKMVKLVGNPSYSYEFKKKDTLTEGYYSRDPADLQPYDDEPCNKCHIPYGDHGEKGEAVDPASMAYYKPDFKVFDHDWEEGWEPDYDDRGADESDTSDECPMCGGKMQFNHYVMAKQCKDCKYYEEPTEYGDEVKKKSEESNINPTIEDIKKWWDEDNVSQRQHAVDPNKLDNEESLRISEKNYDDLTDEDKVHLHVAYSFRHQEADMKEILGYDVSENSNVWWDTYNASQRQHMIDPHQIIEGSLEFASKNYLEMTSEEKSKVDEIFDQKHSESSSATTHAKEGGHGSGRVGHAPWMNPITKKQDAPETRDDIPIEKINEVDQNHYECGWCGTEFNTKEELEAHKDEMSRKYHPTFRQPSEEGILSDYLLKRNGQDFSYCKYCNASTKHLYGKCTNCPPPKLTNQPQTPTKKNNTPPYDITNVKPSDDPDDAKETLEKLTKVGLENDQS